MDKQGNGDNLVSIHVTYNLMPFSKGVQGLTFKVKNLSNCIMFPVFQVVLL